MMPTLPELMAMIQMQGGAPEYIGNILNAYPEKNFVQRILKPDINPMLDMSYQQNGRDYTSAGTHLMSSANYNGQNIVYPEIIQLPNGNLTRLDPRLAFEYAINNNEYIPFQTPEEAEWFGQNYKRVWGGEYNK